MEQASCPCMQGHWVRNAGFEYGAGRLPMSNHHPNCPEFKLAEFVRVKCDGSSCIVEPHEVERIVGESTDYECERVLMTRDQFERLPEFEGL